MTDTVWCIKGSPSGSDTWGTGPTFGSHKHAFGEWGPDGPIVEAPSTLYHVAPKEARNAIEAEGLQARGDPDVDPQPAVFMTPRHPSNTTNPYFWHPERDDVYEVNVQGLPIHHDPWGDDTTPDYLKELGGSLYHPGHIGPERIRRLEWPQGKRWYQATGDEGHQAKIGSPYEASESLLPINMQQGCPRCHSRSVDEETGWCTSCGYTIPYDGHEIMQGYDENGPVPGYKAVGWGHAMDDSDLDRRDLGEPHWGSWDKIATNSYYHVAPTEDRARFQTHGPQLANPAVNPQWSDDGISTTDAPGFYAWNSLPAATKYRDRLNEQRGKTHDIWEVRAPGGWFDEDPEIYYEDALKEYGGQSLVYRGDKPLTNYNLAVPGESDATWPNKTAAMGTGIPVKYYPTIDPRAGGWGFKGWEGRLPMLYDPQGMLHVGPEGSVHMDLVRQLHPDDYPEDRINRLYDYHNGWIGNNPEGHGEAIFNDVPVGWYRRGRGLGEPDPLVSQRAAEYFRTHHRPPSSAPWQFDQSSGGFGHGYAIAKTKTAYGEQYDPTICQHCWHPMGWPKLVQGTWMNTCTNCGRTRAIPPNSPLLKQQQQDWPHYPDLLNQVSQPRPWFSFKTPSVTSDPKSPLPNGHHEQSNGGDVNQPPVVKVPNDGKQSRHLNAYELAEKRARAIISRAHPA